MNLEGFHKKLVKFFDDMKGKEKTPYNDGYKDAVRYIIDWIEEYL